MEETIDKTELKNTGNGAKRDRREASEPCVLSEITIREENKTLTGIKELDRVLGGGIVQGSLTLVGGDPGIGKSTLLLQVCHNLSTAGHKVLYISGEESKVQIKMRADRLGAFSEPAIRSEAVWCPPWYTPPQSRWHSPAVRSACIPMDFSLPRVPLSAFRRRRSHL